MTGLSITVLLKERKKYLLHTMHVKLPSALNERGVAHLISSVINGGLIREGSSIEKTAQIVIVRNIINCTETLSFNKKCLTCLSHRLC